MELQEMIKHINNGLASEKMCLSLKGEVDIEAKWKKKPENGGFSNYWKDISYDEVPRNS